MRSILLVALAGLVGCVASPAPVPHPLPSEAAVPAELAAPLALALATVVVGPATASVGQQVTLILRAPLPAAAELVELVARPTRDAFTRRLELGYRAGLAAPVEPRDLAVRFTPGMPGAYYFDGERRFPLLVLGTGAGIGSFLDRAPGQYVPSVAATSSVPEQWGAPELLAATVPGPLRGNPGVLSRRLERLEGPTSGSRGQRLVWTATAWSGWSGPLGFDVVQGTSSLALQALLAPGAVEPLGAPVPRLVTGPLGWIFQDPGTYRLQTGEGRLLGTVTIR